MKIFIKILFVFAFLLTLALGTTACQIITPEPAPQKTTPAPIQVTGIVLVPPTLTPLSRTATLVRPNHTITTIPTVRPSSTRTPTPIRLPAILTGTPTHVQVKTQVNVFFSVNNPNSDLATSSIPYQVTAFDVTGSVITTHSAYINTIFPGETQPVVDSFAVEPGQTVAKIDIRLNSHRFEATQSSAPLFISSQVTFYPNTNPIVTAIIKNKNDDEFYDLKVMAILYNANETIIGGGYTYLNFLPGDGQSAVKVYVKNTATPARVELYTTLSSLSLFSKRNAVTEPAIKLLDYGFSQTDTITSTAIVAQNTHNDWAFDRSQYQITLYDADNVVLDCVQGYFDLSFPGEKMGSANLFYLSKGQKVARVDAQLISGSRSDPIISANPFQIENITYLPGTITKASAILKSTYPQDLTNIEVNVVAYDQDDKIIGGGRRYANLVPANGQIEIEIPIYLSQTPARLELYPGITSITKIGN
jgi:hypothetical protein